MITQAALPTAGNWFDLAAPSRLPPIIRQIALFETSHRDSPLLWFMYKQMTLHVFVKLAES